MSKRIQPFSNGGEYAHWVGKNCANCEKSWYNGERSQCQIEQSLDDAACFDGTVRKKIYDRMGTDSGKCPEKEVVR